MTVKKIKWMMLCTMILSLVAIVFSVAALCGCNAKPEDMNSDNTGFIVGVLCVLVTILVGFNIYNSIEFRENIALLKRHNKDIENLYKVKGNKKTKLGKQGPGLPDSQE